MPQVSEPEGGSAEVFQATIDRLGGAVRSAGAVEVGQHVVGAALQGPTQGDHLGQRLRHAAAEGLDQLAHLFASLVAVLVAVGGDHPLVDAPGRFDFDVTPVTGLIFHMSRCGSTLLARVAAQDPSVLVLNEPELLNQLLRRGAVSPGLYRSAVGALIAEVMPDAERVILKPPSWHNTYAQLVTAAFPNAHRVVLIRDPVQVLRSLCRQPSAWALNQLGPARRAGGPAVDQAFLSATAALIAEGLANLTDLVEQSPVAWRLIDYQTLLKQPVEVCSWLGAEVTASHAETEMRYDSKSRAPWQRGRIAALRS